MSEDFPNRQSIRLKGFDYTNRGYYFVTICTHGRENLFGKITNAKMTLNECGIMVERWLSATTKHFTMISIDKFIIMPNHIHMVINVGAGFPRPKNNKYKHEEKKNNILNIGRENLAPTLGNIVAYFKYQTSKEFNMINILLKKLWQRNYYERIIRDETELWQARKYIGENPTNWLKDKLFN